MAGGNTADATSRGPAEEPVGPVEQPEASEAAAPEVEATPAASEVVVLDTGLNDDADGPPSETVHLG